jgi:hypothetical protein
MDANTLNFNLGDQKEKAIGSYNNYNDEVLRGLPAV